MANTTSKKILHTEIRNRYLEAVTEFLAGKGEEVLRTGSQEIAIPCVDKEGNEEFIVLTFKVPTGGREKNANGEYDAYDGYAVAEEYAMNVAEKAEKARIAEEKKKAKIAKDESKRKQLAEAKAQREKERA